MKDNFIEVYNVITPEDCQKVINAFELAHKVGLTENRQQHDSAKKVHKEDLACFCPFWEFPLNHSSMEVSSIINDALWNKAYVAYSNKYGILKELGEHSSFETKIQKTEPGQGYHIWHCEQGDRAVANRVLTWTAYLNDDFEAGETEFLYQQYRYKPKQGDVVIFPAAYTHTHRGNPPIGGVKYIATGWIEF